MKKWLFLILLFAFACNQKAGIPQEKTKNEVLEAEKAFAKMAAEKSMKEAFLAFAAEDAVLNRGPQLIKGKAAIKNYFEEQTLQDVQLTWEPEFVDVSASGDLGYTYGPFTFSAKDTSGNAINSTGFFHTVWKKQKNGEWKYVYD